MKVRFFKQFRWSQFSDKWHSLNRTQCWQMKWPIFIEILSIPRLCESQITKNLIIFSLQWVVLSHHFNLKIPFIWREVEKFKWILLLQSIFRFLSERIKMEPGSVKKKVKKQIIFSNIYKKILLWNNYILINIKKK